MTKNKIDLMNEIERGDSNKIAREYIESLLIETRHIDAKVPSTELELYGTSLKTPVMSAAFSHLYKLADDGMCEMARGMKRAGAISWVGMGSAKELKSIIRENPNTIKIVKPHADNKLILDEIRQAEEAGAIAVGMDIDHVFTKDGGTDGFEGTKMAPKSMDELALFVQLTKLPFIVKGVLSESDAQKCVQIGAGGMVVSHHHGLMDYAIPPLMVLPDIASIADGKMPVFVDCGISSGLDAFKALALGATAVCAGRSLIPILQEKGAKGIAQEMNAITKQLAGAMAKTGCASISKITPDIIWTRTGRMTV
jgi:isopentenyl diphosphate isomerase/L-lactate dehydrogenase-like FMN-dependent dehydrogenase